MALTERIELDLRDAQRQIAQLEQQLQGLSTPVAVPVNISGEGDLERIRRELGLSDDAAENLNRELAQTDEELRQAGSQAQRTGADIESAGRRGGTAFAGLRGSVVGLIGAFGAIQGARAFLDFAGDAIGAASDLEESTSKATVVFGEFFDEIEAFAQTGPQALGLANAQALEFAGTFGNLFVALGLSQQAAAELAPEIVQLGADLASFNNIEVTEALDKLRAGLVGEAEPLRVLGVNLTAAATAAKAVELGLASSTNEVSEAAKVQARYALILEQTATAQGDFARTADGIANTQRSLAAEFENFRASVGEALLPLFASLLEITPAVVDALENTLVPALAGLSASFESVDTGGFIAFLAGLPSGIQTAGSQFSSGAQAFVNAFDVLGSIAQLDFGDVGEQFRQLGDDIQDFRGAGAANEAVQTLIQTLASGRDPVAALESTLVDLGESVSSLTLDQFEPLALQLIEMAIAAGATGPELAALADTILQFGEDAGFSAAGVEVLADALRGPLAQAQAQASAGDIIAENLRGIGDAAGEAAPEVETFGAAVASFPASNIADIVDDIESELDRLPGLLEGARTALEGEDGPVSDADTFIGNLLTDLEELENFQADINIARALGLDDTAALAVELGPEFAGVLADAIEDPATAAQLESAIEGFADAEAAFTKQAITTSLLEQFEDAVEVPLNIDFILQNVRLPGAGNLLENIDLGPGPSGGGGGGQERRGRGSGGVVVVQNFDNTPGPNTETQRAAQQVNAMIQVE